MDFNLLIEGDYRVWIRFILIYNKYFLLYRLLNFLDLIFEVVSVNYINEFVFWN